MSHFDVIVIGKGLIGSAAAKYLSFSEKKIAVIGPDEPLDHQQSLVYASHYDQGRIQRLLGKDEIWTMLNVSSVQQYANMEQKSDIVFHNPVGCLYVNPHGADFYLRKVPKIAAEYNLTYEAYTNAKDLSLQFKNYHFPDDANGILEQSPSGIINPRLLVLAQLTILSQNGGEIIKETALEILEENGLFLVNTHEGQQYKASKILIAAGSFVNFLKLLPEKLDLKIKGELVLLVKVSAKQAEQLAQLPSLLYEINIPEIDGIYLIQPIRYPDGAYYIKMGANIPEDLYFQNLSQAQNWFRNGNSEQFKARLIMAFKKIMPHVKVIDFSTTRCIINRSVTGRPYIGETNQAGLFVAAGCNGYSAMCSDGIGSVVATLMHTGSFPVQYPANSFEVFYQ